MEKIRKKYYLELNRSDKEKELPPRRGIDKERVSIVADIRERDRVERKKGRERVKRKMIRKEKELKK